MKNNKQNKNNCSIEQLIKIPKTKDKWQRITLIEADVGIPVVDIGGVVVDI